jgi:hypothetical protein
LKRDVVEGEKAEEAKRKITRASSRALRKAARESADSEMEETQRTANAVGENSET